MGINKRKIGTLGEEAARDFMVKSGYNIICSNYRIGRYGEIDIIAEQDGYICFVEVKSRSSELFGMPCEAVNYYKQRNIKKIASAFIQSQLCNTFDIRFDVVEVIYNIEENIFKVKEINIIKNAF